MKIAIVITTLLCLYLRRPIKCFIKISKISKLIDLYIEYDKATGEQKITLFLEIAKKRPLTVDLLGVYSNPPSYEDARNEDKIKHTFLSLLETLNWNKYHLWKYFHPKYILKDVFFLPAITLTFLLDYSFKEGSSRIISFFAWLLAILVSLYSTELKNLIGLILGKITKTI